MTKEQLHILQHALGLDEFGRGSMYRNHFCAGGDDEVICKSLVDLGYMQRHATTPTMPYYNCSVTEAGKAAVLRESPVPPKLTRGQRKYREYLKVADCLNMTFIEWLKYKRERTNA